MSLDEIYDIYAVRVVFECDDEENAQVQCWQIYTYFADGHKTHPDRLRDWLSAPKANGYQALHLTAMGPDGKWIEVQIRSRKMHEIAELGYAAHWKYKTGDKDDDSELDNWMNTIKDILANPEPSAIDFLDTIKLNLYASEIYVFTPKGDLQILPKGATVLDMAYAIHTELGAHCIAGKINHRLVPLSHELSSGDQVEIITSDSQSPQSEWLKFCRTAKAQTAIRSMMRKDYKGLVERGSRLFMEFMSKEGIEPTNEIVSKILGRFHLKNRDELYVMLANDEILLPVEELRKMTESRQSLFSKLLRNPFSSKKKDDTGSTEKINRKEIYVLYSDDKTSNYRIEDCCCPIPGDDVLGFVDDDEKVVLHKADCAVAMRLKSTYGNRLVATRWERHADKFVVTISIDGIDRKGMLEDLTAVLSRELCINIRELNIKADQEVFHCDLTVQVDSTATVELICSSLKKIKGVKFAKRIS